MREGGREEKGEGGRERGRGEGGRKREREGGKGRRRKKGWGLKGGERGEGERVDIMCGVYCSLHLQAISTGLWKVRVAAIQMLQVSQLSTARMWCALGPSRSKAGH